MSVGRGAGIALALGIATGSFAWSVMTVVGLSALLAQYALALFIIKIFGGLFLLWLAYKSFKSATAKHDIDAVALAGGKRTPLGYAKRGFIIQMTNPKAALAWIAIISLGLTDGAPNWVGMAIVVGTFMLSILIHMLYAVAFSTPVMVRLYSKARRRFQSVLGAFFAFAGLRLFISRN